MAYYLLAKHHCSAPQFTGTELVYTMVYTVVVQANRNSATLDDLMTHTVWQTV